MDRTTVPRLSLLNLSILMLSSTASANVLTPTGDDAAPTIAEASHATLPDMSLILEVVINGRSTGSIIPVTRRGQHYYVANTDVQALNLPLNAGSEPSIAIDTLPNLVVQYDDNNQQLLINVPLTWLPQQHLRPPTRPAAAMAQTSTGFLLNYDIYSHKAGANSRIDTSVYLEQRLFGHFGFVTNNGVYAQSAFSSSSDARQQPRYLRYDTRWHYNDDQRMLQYALGDITTDALTWTGSVRLGGIRFGRNFDTNPDLITYPLPQFSGQAAVPSAVDLYINSFKQSSANINPGPFTIETMPYINGAGQATVVTTDALGRQVSTAVPFYVSSELLKPGLSDFSVSIGAIRQNYGIDSFKYGNMAASSVARYGLTPYLTLDARAEGASNLALGGIGGTLLLGHLGVLSSSFNHSRARSDKITAPNAPETTSLTMTNHILNGQQASIGYTYNNAQFSLNAKHVQRSRDYGDLASYKSPYRLDRRIRQLTASINLKQYGALGLGYFDVLSAQNERLRLLNLSFSRALWRNSHLFVSANRAIGGRGYSAQISLSIPLASQQMASLSSSRNEAGHWTQRIDYSHTAPTEGGLGWQLSYADGAKAQDHYQQASLDWQTQKTRLQGGVYGHKDTTYWSELSGALIIMDGQFYAAKQVNDAFSLVSTDGYANVPIRYENKLIGHTDHNGYLLIPNVSSYVRGLYEIDSLNLEANLKPVEVEQRQAIKQGAGLLISFPIQEIHAANLILVDQQGQPLPRGSMVTLLGNGQTTHVGWDGLAYIEQLGPKNQLRIMRSDNQQLCHAEFIPERTAGLYAPTTPIICQSEQP